MDEGTMQRKDWHGAIELMRAATADKAVYSDKRRMQECFEFLDRLIQEKRVTGKGPLDEHVVQVVLMAWSRFVEHAAKSLTNDGKDDLAPSFVFKKLWQFARTGLVEKDFRPFGVVLQVMAKVEPEKVEESVRWMEEQKDDHLKPDSHCWAAALSGWRHLGAPERCEALLRDLEEEIRNKRMDPQTLDSFRFSVAIAAWSESTNPAAARKANDIFEMMGQLGLGPDSSCFTSLLWAFGRSREADAHIQVEQIFHQMQQAWKDGDDTVKPDVKDPIFQPDARLYLAVIHSVAYGGLGEDVVRKLLDKMELKSAWHPFWEEAVEKAARHAMNGIRSSSFISKSSKRELLGRLDEMISGRARTLQR